MSHLTKTILVINAGSSSIKFQLFDLEDNLKAVAKGLVEGIGSNPAGKAKDSDSETKFNLTPDANHKSGMEAILDWIHSKQKWEIVAAGHRVVHGGVKFTEPTKLNEDIFEELLELTPLAPLHQPHHIVAMKSLMELDSSIPQVGCFDTAFHAGQEKIIKAFALPKKYYDEGVKRYGFHGLSYQYIAEHLKEEYPHLYKGKTVVCHLGNGSSVCAISGGKSIDSSMGMSVMEGVPMGTRTGSIDPGAVLYIMEQEKLDFKQINDLISKKSGLLGMSGGLSNDMRELRTAAAEGNADAKFAIDYYVLRIAQIVMRMAVSMGGIDGLVFTAGIGENSKETRDEVVAHLKNICNFEVHVIPTNEELMIAQSTKKVLGL